MPVAFLRAAWFMENAAWDIDSAKSGAYPEYLQRSTVLCRWSSPTTSVARRSATARALEERVVRARGPTARLAECSGAHSPKRRDTSAC